jgi:hypothetical protein
MRPCLAPPSHGIEGLCCRHHLRACKGKSARDKNVRRLFVLECRLSVPVIAFVCAIFALENKHGP